MWTKKADQLMAIAVIPVRDGGLSSTRVEAVEMIKMVVNIYFEEALNEFID